MTTMKSVRTAGPGTIEVAEIERPVPGPGGPADADTCLRHLRHRCGVRADGRHATRPGRADGSDPARARTGGRIVEVGAEVTGLKTGERVVVNPRAAPAGIIGCDGALGGTPVTP